MGKSKHKEEGDPILRVLKESHRGDVIKIRANNLNDENQAKIRDYVEKQDEVTVLSIQGSIGLKGLQRFSPILCNHAGTLTRLCLKANDFRVPAVLDLVCALELPQNKTLEVLDLSSNPIGSEGFKVLMSNSLLNTKLAALLVAKCSIGDAGVVQSQAYIKDKRRPDGGRFYINLSQNNVGTEGHSAIVAAIPPWMSLSLTRQKPPVILASPAMHALPAPSVPPPAAVAAATAHSPAGSPLRQPEPTTQRDVPPQVPAADDDDEEEEEEEEDAEDEEGKQVEEGKSPDDGGRGTDEPPAKRRIVCIMRQPTRLVPVKVGSQRLLGILRPLDSSRRLVTAVLE
ncbi:Leucine Rich repeat [Diplonema papillatum]|nr:Leucine Rich repeat [Diplonema papillatum]